MQIRYDAEADVLLVTSRDLPPADAIVERSGVVVSLGQDGQPVGVEFLNAAKRRLVRPGEVRVAVGAATRWADG